MTNRDRSLFRDFAADFYRSTERSRTSIPRMLGISLLNSGLLATMILRTQLATLSAGRVTIAKILRQANCLVTGADFALGCSVGPGLIMKHPNGIVVGVGAIIGAECTLLHQVTLGDSIGRSRSGSLYPTVADGVIIGAGAKILGGVTIGSHARIGANAVVLIDVPRGAVAVGVPARILA